MKLNLARIQRNLIILKFAVVIFLVCVVNLKSTVEGYFKFYKTTKGHDTYTENILYQFAQNLEGYKPVSLFLCYSGLETGYGFFAPNVASKFVTEFILKDEHGNVIEESTFVPISSKESMIRVASTYTTFLKYLEEENLPFEIGDVILKGLTFNVLKNNKQASEITTNLYLYHYPTLAELGEDPDALPRLIPVKTTCFSTEDLWETPRNNTPNPSNFRP